MTTDTPARSGASRWLVVFTQQSMPRRGASFLTMLMTRRRYTPRSCRPYASDLGRPCGRRKRRWRGPAFSVPWRAWPARRGWVRAQARALAQERGLGLAASRAALRAALRAASVERLAVQAVRAQAPAVASH